jgi:hypothetical protein
MWIIFLQLLVNKILSQLIYKCTYKYSWLIKKKYVKSIIDHTNLLYKWLEKKLN